MVLPEGSKRWQLELRAARAGDTKDKVGRVVLLVPSKFREAAYIHKEGSNEWK